MIETPPTHATGSLTTEIVRTATGLDDLRHDWEQLFAEDAEAHAFQAWIPTVRLWQMNPEDVEPRVIVVRAADTRIVGLFALGIQRQRHGPVVLRRLRPLAAPRYSHAHPLIDPAHRVGAEAAVRDAFMALADEVDEVDVRFARHTRWLSRPPLGLEVVITDVMAVETRLASTVTRWEELLSRSSRYNVRRDGRLLRAAHSVETALLATPGGVERWWPQFRRLHTTRSRALGRRAYFEMGQAPSRFAPMLFEMIEAGLAEFHVMTNGDSLVAGQVVFRHRRTAHSYRITFDERYAQYSPGTQLQAEVLQRSIDLGDERFDFGHGHEAYKLRWGNERVKVLQIHGGSGLKFRIGRGYSALAQTISRTGVLGRGPGGPDEGPSDDPE